LGILPGIFNKKNNFGNIFWQEHFKNRKNLKIFIFPWKIVRGETTTLNLLFFRVKFSNFEKIILGILPGIFNKKNNFGNIFWQEHLKKKFEKFYFSWKIVRGGKTT
jgi:hypothetical protein